MVLGLSDKNYCLFVAFGGIILILMEVGVL
jgi:hypothetical protein